MWQKGKRVFCFWWPWENNGYLVCLYNSTYKMMLEWYLTKDPIGKQMACQ